MKGGARRLPELASDDLRLPHPRRHRRRRDLAPKREGAGRQHLESSAAVLCSVSAWGWLRQGGGPAALVLSGTSGRAAAHDDRVERVGSRED